MSNPIILDPKTEKVGVTVTEPGKTGSVSASQDDPKGMLPGAIPIRKAWNKKQVGLIKFYDTGQKTDGHGGWIQNNYRYDPGVQINHFGFGDVARCITPITLTQIRAFEATILAGVTPENISTIFRQIHKSDGNSFPVNFWGIQFDTPSFFPMEWLENGIKMQQSVLDALVESNGPPIEIQVRRATEAWGEVQICQDLFTGALSGHTSRITLGNTFESPEVDFHPSVKDSYYVIPQLTYSAGVSVNGNTTVYLNLFFHMPPRNFINHDYVADSFYSSPNWTEAVGYHTGLTGTHTYTVIRSEDVPGVERLALSPGGSFPITGGEVDPTVRFMLSDIFQGQGFQFDGQLKGLVKQGSKLYYVWHIITS